MKQKVFLFSTLVFFATSWTSAEDWPEWRGRGRAGIWSESGILSSFPATGLKTNWRTPIRNGYSGPAVAQGRVFVTDFARQQGNRGIERALCLEERTGKILWTREWEADYISLMETYATGPRATPTVDQDRVYVLGSKGKLLCLSVKTGSVLWERDYQKDYQTEVPVWGMTAAPLVEGDLLICLVGGKSNAKVVAFEKRTGKEAWRALSSDSEPGYSPPFALTAGGRRQVIIWHPQAVSALEPATGKLLWEVPFKADTALSVATPVLSGRHLLVSSFYNGSMLLKLDEERPQADLIWKGKSKSEIDTDGLHSLISTPVIVRRICLWHLQLRPVSLSGFSHGQSHLGNSRSHQGKGSLGRRFSCQERRPFLHQQRSRRVDHREALSARLPGDWTDSTHQADDARRQSPGTGRGKLVASSVCQPADPCAQ